MPCHILWRDNKDSMMEQPERKLCIVSSAWIFRVVRCLVSLLATVEPRKGLVEMRPPLSVTRMR